MSVNNKTGKENMDKSTSEETIEPQEKVTLSNQKSLF